MAARAGTESACFATGWVDIQAPSAFARLFTVLSDVIDVDPKAWNMHWYNDATDLVDVLQKVLLSSPELSRYICTVHDVALNIQHRPDDSPMSMAVHSLLSEAERDLIERVDASGLFPFPTQGGRVFQIDCDMDECDRFTNPLLCDEDEARERAEFVVSDEDEAYGGSPASFCGFNGM